MKFLVIAGILLCLVQTTNAQTSRKDQSKMMVPFRDGDRWGYSDTLGKIIVQPVYDNVSLIAYDGFIYKNGKQGVIHESGKVIIPPVYDAVVSQFQFEELYMVEKNHKRGLLTNAGKQVIPILFDSVMSIDVNLILVSSKGKYGLYNGSGKLLLPVQYDEITDAFFDEKVDHSKAIMARKGDKYWRVSKQTGRAIPYIFQGDDSEEGMVEEGIVESPIPENYYGSPLTADSVKKKLQADRVVEFSFKTKYGYTSGEDYFLVIKDGKQGLFHKSGSKLIVPPNYDSVLYVLQSISSQFLPKPSVFLIAVKKDGRAGIINEKGDIILPFDYDGITGLEGNTNGFELSLNGKKGIYLLLTNYPVIAPKYDRVRYEDAIQVNSNWNFSLYMVWYKGKMGYVGENGVEYFK